MRNRLYRRHLVYKMHLLGFSLRQIRLGQVSTIYPTTAIIPSNSNILPILCSDCPEVIPAPGC